MPSMKASQSSSSHRGSLTFSFTWQSRSKTSRVVCVLALVSVGYTLYELCQWIS